MNDNILWLQEILEKFNLHGSTITKIEHTEAIVAVVYKIVHASETYILKISAKPEHFYREVYALNFFANILPVPKIIQLIQPEDKKSGGPLHSTLHTHKTLRTTHSTLHTHKNLDRRKILDTHKASHKNAIFGATTGVILMEYLSGHLLEESDLNKSLSYEIGELLAQIHKNRLKVYGDFGSAVDSISSSYNSTNINSNNSSNASPRTNFISKFEEGIKECQGHLPKVLLDKCLSYCKDHVYLLDSVDGPCMTHRDFRPGNLIINQGKVKGIIDWASAYGGFAEEDFCALEHAEWPFTEQTKASFLEGYAKVRPLPDYKRIMPLLRLSRSIAILGFIFRESGSNGVSATHAKLYQVNREFLETFYLF